MPTHYTLTVTYDTGSGLATTEIPFDGSWEEAVAEASRLIRDGFRIGTDRTDPFQVYRVVKVEAAP